MEGLDRLDTVEMLLGDGRQVGMTLVDLLVHGMQPFPEILGGDPLRWHDGQGDEGQHGVNDEEHDDGIAGPRGVRHSPREDPQREFPHLTGVVESPVQQHAWAMALVVVEGEPHDFREHGPALLIHERPVQVGDQQRRDVRADTVRDRQGQQAEGSDLQDLQGRAAGPSEAEQRHRLALAMQPIHDDAGQDRHL